MDCNCASSAYVQVIELDHDFGDTFCGILADRQGHMTALWANYNEQSGSDDMEEYCRGISVFVIKPWLQQVGCHQALPCITAPTFTSMLVNEF